MNTDKITTTAKSVVAKVGNTAHNAIGLYREGGERLAGAMDQRWNTALKQSAPKLSAETRKNAQHAHDVFQGYYARGLALSADGAEIVIDTVIGATIAVIERAATLPQTFAHKTA
jgi:hypothetical protein